MKRTTPLIITVSLVAVAIAWASRTAADDSNQQMAGQQPAPDNTFQPSGSLGRSDTWSDPEPLNNTAAIDSGGDGDPQVICDGTGQLVAVWCSYDDLGGTIGKTATSSWPTAPITVPPGQIPSRSTTTQPPTPDRITAST